MTINKGSKNTTGPPLKRLNKKASHTETRIKYFRQILEGDVLPWIPRALTFENIWANSHFKTYKSIEAQPLWTPQKN